ncbi:hypothetical protein NLU13_4296 [Sarocladium strictum]|uniref:Uncharacterized protein n=1 Tax=Sarocladium strictum TaxID=5046 RepID=A0AA39L8I7_SARSR|nr:hypothetical protein NLU13_4296 [Sarocladium strictum]
MAALAGANLALTTLSIIGGVIKAVDFGLDQYAKHNPEFGSTVKFAVALDGTFGGHTMKNAGGDLPDVRNFAKTGEFLGATYDPGVVKDGNVGEVHIKHDKQAAYSLMSANKDSICIAWATMTWADKAGGNKYALDGGVAKECGASWYFSNMYPSSSHDYQPPCFWIDSDASNKKHKKHTGFQVRWTALGQKEEELTPKEKENPQRFCNNVDFGFRTERDPSRITHWARAKKRNEIPKDHQSARELCLSMTSSGPDFYHTKEELFCDMETHTLYRLCGQPDVPDKDCFDANFRILYHNSRKRGNRRSKTYRYLVDWSPKVLSPRDVPSNITSLANETDSSPRKREPRRPGSKTYKYLVDWRTKDESARATLSNSTTY